MRPNYNGYLYKVSATLENTMFLNRKNVLKTLSFEDKAEQTREQEVEIKEEP